MRKSVLAAVLFASVSLCACRGGGGGGGGLNGLGDSDVFSYVPANGELYSDDGVSVTKVDGGLRLDVDGSGGLAPVFHRNVDFRTARDFKEEGNYFTAQKTGAARQFSGEGSEGYGDINGRAAITDKIYLGGKKLGLEYSEFGIWQVTLSLKGRVEGQDINGDLDVGAYTFAAGQNGFERGITENSGQASFIGRAIGQAFDENLPVTKTVNIYGTAKLDLDLGAGDPTGVLALDFDNFYKFNINMQSDSGGQLQSTSLANVTANNNTTGINLDTAAGYYLDVEGSSTGRPAARPRKE